MTNFLRIKKPYANIREIDVKNRKYGLKINAGDNDNIVRAYPSMPKHIGVEIRAYCGIGEYGRGKKRTMVAEVNMTMAEIEELYNFAKENIT